MQNGVTIGKISKVPLREVWKHEAHDFTTWMEMNMDVLNNVLDMQLINPKREHGTENFSVDIVAEDESGNIVVIENQLEKSNHDHLGKIITYLSAVNASKAVWIVSEPRQEHIKAVSWLNESELAEFYLLKVEGIKIGDSLPAPLFTLIVGPSEAVREAGETKKEYAERHHLRKQFWKYLLEEAKGFTKLHSNITPGMYGWIGTGAGISGVTYNYGIGQHDAKVELYIDHDKENGELNKRIFDALFSKKEQIEQIYGSGLTWERLDDKRASRIAEYFNTGGYRDEEKWKIISNEMIQKMVKLEQAISQQMNNVKTIL